MRCPPARGLRFWSCSRPKIPSCSASTTSRPSWGGVRCSQPAAQYRELDLHRVTKTVNQTPSLPASSSTSAAMRRRGVATRESFVWFRYRVVSLDLTAPQGVFCYNKYRSSDRKTAASAVAGTAFFIFVDVLRQSHLKSGGPSCRFPCGAHSGRGGGVARLSHLS